MILSGTLHAVPDTDRPQWRAAASGDADRAATTQAQHVDQVRHADVRYALAVIRGAQTSGIAAADRQAMAAKVLADSVERQARVAGLGRIHIPVGGAA
jgi:hypothetical protein